MKAKIIRRSWSHMGDFLACGKKFDRHPHVSTPNFKDLRKETVFTVSELKKLFNRFLELCSEDGLVTKTDFMMQPEISFLPLTSVVFDYETIQSPDLLPSLTLERRSPGIDFTTFVKIVNLLSPKLDLHLKYKCKYI